MTSTSLVNEFFKTLKKHVIDTPLQEISFYQVFTHVNTRMDLRRILTEDAFNAYREFTQHFITSINKIDMTERKETLSVVELKNLARFSADAAKLLDKMNYSSTVAVSSSAPKKSRRPPAPLTIRRKPASIVSRAKSKGDKKEALKALLCSVVYNGNIGSACKLVGLENTARLRNDMCKLILGLGDDTVKAKIATPRRAAKPKSSTYQRQSEYSDDEVSQSRVVDSSDDDNDDDVASFLVEEEEEVEEEIDDDACISD